MNENKYNLGKLNLTRCGVKEFGHPGPLYTKPKAHVEEEEMPEDE